MPGDVWYSTLATPLAFVMAVLEVKDPDPEILENSTVIFGKVTPN